MNKIKKIFEKGFQIEDLLKKTKETDYFLARSCFNKYVIDKYKINYVSLSNILGTSSDTVRFSYINFERYCFQFDYLKDKYDSIVKKLSKNTQINNNEIDFMIELLEKNKRNYNGFDVVLENSSLHNVDIYFLQNKLEELKG